MHSGDGRNSISPSRGFEVPEETCKKRHACRHPAIIGPAGKESFSDHRGGTGYTTCWERNTGIGLDNGRLKAERNWPTNQSPSILFVTRALPRGLETSRFQADPRHAFFPNKLRYKVDSEVE